MLNDYADQRESYVSLRLHDPCSGFDDDTVCSKACQSRLLESECAGTVRDGIEAEARPSGAYTSQPPEKSLGSLTGLYRLPTHGPLYTQNSAGVDMTTLGAVAYSSDIIAILLPHVQRVHASVTTVFLMNIT